MQEGKIMAHKGIVKGNTIEIENTLGLPEGAIVEIEIRKGPSRGNPQAILEYLQETPPCNKEDVDALLKEIHQGKKEVQFNGVFDKEPKDS